jgi:gluconokinase
MAAFILMGVSGSGKSTIGRCVGTALALPFVEGDDFHPAENVRKMAGGTPLDDDDRIAWIDALMQAVNVRPERNVLVACSALTAPVRAKIRAQSTRPVYFLHLTADPALIAQRLQARGPHFMKAGMLPSQLATLQTPESAITVDTTPGLDQVCATVTSEVNARLS